MVNLFNYDCLKLMKNIEDESIDLILTDPPYAISKNSGFSSGTPTGKNTDRFRISIDFGDWDTEINLEEFVKQSYRVLRKGGTIIMFYDLWKITNLSNALTQANFKQLRFIEWVKTNPVPVNSKVNYLTNAREIAVSAVKGGKPVFHSEYDNGIYKYPICHEKNRIHPTQKTSEFNSRYFSKTLKRE